MILHIFGFTILSGDARDAEMDVMRAAYRLNQVIWLYGENNEVPTVIEDQRKPLATAISLLPAEDQTEIGES